MIFMLFSLLNLMITAKLMASTQLWMIEWNLTLMTSTNVSIPIILDPMGLMFSTTIMFISANVLMFSKFYMKGDPLINKFTLIVMLFVMSMNILILFPNMLSLLLGWDGLGLSSFLLIIYYQNKKSLSAGMLTALTNRLGDIAIILSSCWLLSQGHWNILCLLPNFILNQPLVTLLLMVAAMTKSAQIPFSSWLPAAMAAPTPVSALVHSSTLVTAGVFLLYRLNPFMQLSSQFSKSLTLIGAMTMTMAGIVALKEMDTKKIIALSTLSQLGLMMMTLGMNLPSLTMSHLIIHALFKSLLFLCAGTLINSYTHSQDIRNMSKNNKKFPHITASMVTAMLALCAYPFMSGFYSKDLIIENMLFSKTNMMTSALMFLGALLTTLYSTRFMLILTSSSPSSSPLMILTSHIHIMPPLTLLAIASVSSGAMITWITNVQTSPTLPMTTKILPLLCLLLGILLSLELWPLLSKPMPPKFNNPYMITSMFFLTPLSTQYTLTTWKFTSLLSLKTVDQGWVTLMGPQGINQLITSMSKTTLKHQSSHITLSLKQMLFFTAIPIIMITTY
uniref:NADH-ubiquinone oxidoreductase chain 5 n=1 Tax=Ramisyllis multicaudata TaxID=1166726 RepID=A0A0K0YD60_RAMMU|nr:NADH dehydrogenase subunit 5 [Ramisyllis multicaudata]AKS48922.1 NADH dehydrogenase subunit 5 [Ramisyllis multicaudata]